MPNRWGWKLNAAAQSDPPHHQVVIGLGSNIEPQANLLLAIAALRQRLQVQAVSSVWRSKPVGGAGADYLNAATLCTTQLDAGTLKQDVLHTIEKKLGRVRSTDKNAPRRIDLDLLTFDGQVLDGELFKYAYIAIPVAEVFPALLDPVSGESITGLAKRLEKNNPLRREELRLDNQK